MKVRRNRVIACKPIRCPDECKPACMLKRGLEKCCDSQCDKEPSSANKQTTNNQQTARTGTQLKRQSVASCGMDRQYFGTMQQDENKEIPQAYLADGIPPV